MRVQLPKPLHGWRAFIGEVGIIVLGVLIALGFGQLADSVHENIIAEQARDAVRAEVRENLWWLDVRSRREPCIQRRLADLRDILAHARRGDPVPVVQHLGVLPHAKITTLRWDANAQAGRASLFSGDEQRSLGNMYYSTAQIWDAQQQETIIWSEMRFIEGIDRFTPADIHDLSIFLAEARYQDWVVERNLRRAHQWAQRLQLAPANPGSFEAPESGSAHLRLCEKLTAPLASEPDL